MLVQGVHVEGVDQRPARRELFLHHMTLVTLVGRLPVCGAVTRTRILVRSSTSA